MSESEQSGAGRREVAYRLFAAEFDDADFSHSESNEERAPNYVITPTGARVNRLFVVGVLTEVEQVSEDVLRARVVDPTGAFVLYAGQYQPDEQAFLDNADTPSFVAVTGKARTFQPDDSDQVFTSVRPESISEVDAGTRDRWTVQTAEQTLTRVGHAATARSLPARGDDLRATFDDHGVDEGLAAGIPLALDHYGTTPAYLAELRDLALDAARLVAGEVDEVESLTLAPGGGGDADLDELADTGVELAGSADDAGSEADASSDRTSPDSGETTETVDAEPSATAESGDAVEPTTSESLADDSTKTEATPETPSQPDTTADTGSETSAQAKTDADTGADEPADDIGDFDPGEFELDEEEREEIEEEYGTEFQSGTDVPEPGEVDIDTPDPDELDEETETETEVEQPDPTTGGETAGVESATAESDEMPTDESDDESGDEQADVDLEDAAVDAMGELDDGDGAGREEIVATLVERHGVSPEDVENAIQDALMDGRCYEPDDATLKPI